MSSTSIITIAIAVIIVAGVGVVLTSARRTGVRGTGTLARETRRKERGALDPSVVTGRVVEQANLDAGRVSRPG